MGGIVPASELPLCTSDLIPVLGEKVIDPSTLPPPDLKSDPVCRLDIKVIQFSAQTKGIGRPAAPSGSAATPNYSWAVLEMDCQVAGLCNPATVNSPQLNQMSYNINFQTPSLNNGGTWNNYHYINRGHVSNPSASAACVGYESMSVGIGKGTVDGILLANNIFGEWLSGTCSIFVANVPPVSGAGALYFNTYRNVGSPYTNWRSDVWLGSWVNVVSINALWSVATDADVGMEIYAASGDKASVVGPLNFVHKVQVAGQNNGLRPFHNTVLASPLNRCTTRSDTPFQVLDVVGNDCTSIATIKP